MVSKISVVGAGIGGLTLGVALQRYGIDVAYYERASEFRIVGSGITVMNNGMEVMDRLGIGDQFREIGDSHHDWTVMDMDEREIFRIKPGKYGMGGAHRSELQQLLLENVADVDVHFGKKCIDVEANEDSTTIRFADGTGVTTSNPVVGADGTFSAVRESLFPDVELRPTGYVVHRGLPEVGPPDELRSSFWQMSGGEYECGMSPYGRKGLGYWFFSQGGRSKASGVENLPPAARPDDLLVRQRDEPYDPAVVKRDILRKLADGPDWVTDIIESTPEESLVSSEPLEVPPMDTWSENRVVLLGDAAHPMTPFLSVGGAVAMEDALVLANCFAENASHREAYEEYEDVRMDRAYDIVRRSRELGRELTDPESDALERYRGTPTSEIEARHTIELPDHPAYA